MKTPPELDRIVDVVLAYRPKTRKNPAAKDFDAIAGTLPSNARSDGGEPIIIRHPSAAKAKEVTPKKRDVDRPSAG